MKKEYYKDGTIQSEVTYKNGKKNGIATYYHPNGKKSLELFFKDDLAEGQSTLWYFKGTINRTGNYKNNKLNGISTTWDENDGYKLSEETYLNDTLNGLYREFHPNGEVKTKGNYKSGKYEGKWEYFDELGLPVGEGLFKNGAGVLKGWYPDGKTIREVHYLDNLKDGSETFWDESGKLEKIIYYKNGKVIKIETF